MKRKERIYQKKLVGMLKQCINAMSFQPTTKHYRQILSARISALTA